MGAFRVSDKYIVKIADFGLSRDVYDKDYYRRDETGGVALPIKWLAVECLRAGVFSSQSDVVSIRPCIHANLLKFKFHFILMINGHIILTVCGDKFQLPFSICDRMPILCGLLIWQPDIYCE